MISDFAAIDWLGRGWLLLLVFTVAVLLAAALRKPCRHLFGTERAFQLWLLPPLAMLVSQLPHAAPAPVTIWSSITSTVASAAIPPPMSAANAHVVDWRLIAVIVWLLGMVVSLLIAVRAQARYRRRLQGALPMVGPAMPCRVLRATTTDIGPALVGAWRSRIVLPADFERRYDETEQALILAHEATHVRRRDGWWCLFARLIAAGFWFNPLAWWALRALRHDQELACDAAVLREHGSQRRSYAAAMLKTQSAAIALPVGCPWSPRHPVTERIAMLKLKPPHTMRRRAGGAMILLIAVGLASVVYAATPAQQAARTTGPADHYTLKIDAAMGGGPADSHFSYCLAPNQGVTVIGTDTRADKFSWKGKFSVAPAAGGQLEVRSQVDTRFDRGDGKLHEQSAKPVVRTLPGQPATVVFGQVVQGKHQQTLEDNTIKLVLTPSLKCEAGVGMSSSAGVIADVEAADAKHAVAREYQLNMSIDLAHDDAKANHEKRVNMALCMAPGKPASVKTHAMNISAGVSPGADGKLGVDLTVADASGVTLTKTQLLGRPNELLHADGPGADDHSRYSIDITPLEGCPARVTETANKGIAA